MDYVDFCDQIYHAIRELERENPDAPIGVHERSIMGRVKTRIGENTLGALFPDDHNINLLILWAIQDLEPAGLVSRDRSRKTGRASGWVKTTQEARSLGDDLSGAWESIVAKAIDGDLRSTLERIVEVWGTGQAHLLRDEMIAEVSGIDLNERQTRQRLASQLDDLNQMGLIEGALSFGKSKVRPTYVGAVLATRRGWTEQAREVLAILERGETVTVDFKRSLSLSTDKQKAEFVKDALAITNTPGNPPHLLVVGVTNDGDFHQPLEFDAKPEQIDQLLASWTAPVLSARVERLGLPHGEVALIYFERKAEDVPYRATRSYPGKLDAASVKYRYGTTTADAKLAEIAKLDAERRRRRRQLGYETDPDADR